MLLVGVFLKCKIGWLINFTDYQKDNYLKPLLEGSKRECYAISEKGAASDVEGSIQSTAEKKERSIHHQWRKVVYYKCQ